MLRAIERGLSLRDFEDMTVGMIMDLIITFNNEHLDEDEKEDEEDKVKAATQKDFDSF